MRGAKSDKRLGMSFGVGAGRLYTDESSKVLTPDLSLSMELRVVGFLQGTSLTDVLRHPTTAHQRIASPEKRLTTKSTVLAAVIARTLSFRAKSPDQFCFHVRDLFREGLSHSPRGRTGCVRGVRGHVWGG